MQLVYIISWRLLFPSSVVQKLEDHCYRFAMNHMTKVVNSEAFSQIDSSIARLIVQKVAQMGAFKTWCHHDVIVYLLAIFEICHFLIYFVMYKEYLNQLSVVFLGNSLVIIILMRCWLTVILEGEIKSHHRGIPLYGFSPTWIGMWDGEFFSSDFPENWCKQSVRTYPGTTDVTILGVFTTAVGRNASLTKVTGRIWNYSKHVLKSMQL